MAIQKKNYAVVARTAGGTHLASWPDFDFRGFTKQLNGGLGECVITLPRTFDDGSVDLIRNNEIEIRVSDKDTLSGVLEMASTRVVYLGYVSLVEREITDGEEFLTVHCLGYWTKLGADFLKDGSQTTLYSNSSSGLTTTSGSQDAADVGEMARAVIDRYQAETDDPKITYTDDSVPDAGVVAEYRFEQKTYKDALDALKNLAPENTYWYVGEDGILHFTQIPETPTHTFVFDRHFRSVRVRQSMEKVRNVLLLWNGDTGSPIYKAYEDAASIEKFGRRGTAVYEYGIDDTGAADAFGAKFLSENAKENLQIICTIIDNNGSEDMGYDIESIQPGDTCRFLGFDPDFDEIFRDNMVITSVQYSPSQAVIQVEIVRSGLIEAGEQARNRIAEIQSGILTVPETYS